LRSVLLGFFSVFYDIAFRYFFIRYSQAEEIPFYLLNK
jgi:hypothetical protein